MVRTPRQGELTRGRSQQKITGLKKSWSVRGFYDMATEGPTKERDCVFGSGFMLYSADRCFSSVVVIAEVHLKEGQGSAACGEAIRHLIAPTV